MLFDGRRLLEQKQTTINPSVAHKSSLDTSSKVSCSSVSSSLSSSSDRLEADSIQHLLNFIHYHMPKVFNFQMFDHDSSGQPISVGHCVVGRMGNITGYAHWIQMIKKHGLPVCMWHSLDIN
uniref:Glyco_hydro_85 domain-containing protein n=1 Tax=Angiostrongylus cantonensis TaxID=6313 RepID=A0A0K0D4Q9_ANGCA